MTRNILRAGFACLAAGLVGVLSGCGSSAIPSTGSSIQGASFQGRVHGGQQPVAGATIQLYAVSTLGDGVASTPLLSHAVTTNAAGSFTITSLYSCPSAGSLVYLAASGGNPGLSQGTNNAALSLMTALGACGNLSPSTNVFINEATTLAAVSSLAPYMNSYTAIGSGTSDEAQLALAFQQAALLVNTATGNIPGAGLPNGFTAPAAVINTLADVLATCVNSAGGVAGDGSACGQLFVAAQPAGSPAPTETIGAALQIAKHSGSNVSSIFSLVSPSAPFQPTLSASPASWAIGFAPGLFQLYVDAGTGRHAIDSNIYGIASYGLDPTFAAEIQVPNQRWGGDGTTRYNWQVDSSNAGFDWYFIGGSGVSNPVPGASADSIIRASQTAGGNALMTIPIIPYVNKTSTITCSFPASVYGAQQSFNPYVHPNGDYCGNSLTVSGAQIIDTTIYANNIDNTPALQAGWVQHMVGTFGTAAHGGVALYQLDNEPGGWSNTHRDVEPNGQPYSQIVALGQQYAAAVKGVDPAAKILGPSDFTHGGWIGSPSAQNGLFAGQYYLQQMATYDQAHGGRILDYFDEHYYPDTSIPGGQFAATRTLWDPTFNSGNFVEVYFFNGPMMLIPRFHQWIAQYDPGTKLAISEYSIDSGNKLITDALAEADVLGIFGREGVDLANMWQTPAPTDPIAYAFRLYRDYDGHGGRFGETGVQSVSTDQTQLVVYGAQRTNDGALTLVILNKTSAAVSATVAFQNFNPVGSASVYSYGAADLTHIVAQASVTPTGNTLPYVFPAYSATVVVLAGH